MRKCKAAVCEIALTTVILSYEQYVLFKFFLELLLIRTYVLNICHDTNFDNIRIINVISHILSSIFDSQTRIFHFKV